MLASTPQFPFAKLSLTPQPFGLRVKCVLDAELIKTKSHITGTAIEATGGMANYFGLGAFSKGMVKELGRSLGEFLGKLDKQGGTTVIYWGTNDEKSIQNLGFRSGSEWGYFQFGKPIAGFGKKCELMPALRYFLEEGHLSVRPSLRGQAEGIFIFLLDGGIDDFPFVLDYLGQFVGDVVGERRKRAHLVFVGMGENFIEESRGQLHALAALSNRANPPVISSLVVRDVSLLVDMVKDSVMEFMQVSKQGAVLNSNNQPIQSFPDGVPGAFQFYIPVGSKSFMLNLDGNLYTQVI